jgi:hypothetical protein
VRLDTSDVIELHAGADYRNFGLVQGLEQRGVSVEIPTEGMRIGEQLRFYALWFSGATDKAREDAPAIPVRDIGKPIT